ncbi:TerB family tellurite resistance protein [Pelagibacterales bacterium SAG-MED37]|nr:TerB family tellurite resistance protein [Pelagibacterales bacterium SAG-MED37]
MFFKKKIEKQSNNQLIKIAALMIHAGKIDENFSKQEELIIKQALLKMGANTENIQEIIEQSKVIEENANQILDFTKEVKAMDDEKKIEIIETLWRIIYSNKDADIYETNLMRRLAGLMYIDNKIMGSIQEKIKKEIS